MRVLAFVPYLLIVAGIALSNTGFLAPMAGWQLCALGVLFGVGVAVTILFTRSRRQQSLFWGFAIIAALPLAIAVPMVMHDLSYPRINDVTTDTDTPPAFVAALEKPANAGRDMTFPEHFGPIVRKGYPSVRPLVLDATPGQVFERIKKLAARQPGWMVTHRNAEKRTLEGEVTTQIFRFVDDFVIRVSDQGGNARVDMRSKSRDGLVDAGANAKRIQAFLGQLESAFASSDSSVGSHTGGVQLSHNSLSG